MQIYLRTNSGLFCYCLIFFTDEFTVTRRKKCCGQRQWKLCRFPGCAGVSRLFRITRTGDQTRPWVRRYFWPTDPAVLQHIRDLEGVDVDVEDVRLEFRGRYQVVVPTWRVKSMRPGSRALLLMWKPNVDGSPTFVPPIKKIGFLFILVDGGARQAPHGAPRRPLTGQQAHQNGQSRHWCKRAGLLMFSQRAAPRSRSSVSDPSTPACSGCRVAG
jgi:hypothetical protein